jgi:AraC family transcriptional regulator
MSWRPTRVGSPSEELPASIRFLRRTSGGAVLFVRADPPGIIETPEFPAAIIAMHIGKSTKSSWKCDGRSGYGASVHGDITIVAPGARSRWEISHGTDNAVVLVLPGPLLETIAGELHIEPSRIDIRSLVHLRDHQMESVCWALKADLESGCTSGALYTDSLITALTARVISRYSAARPPAATHGRGMTGSELRRLLDWLEDNLTLDVSLSTIAEFSGFSKSHLNATFRQAMGVPLHEYVVRRRVDRAKELLVNATQSITEIALECGFAHPSHMARHMRRILGISPNDLRRAAQSAFLQDNKSS